MRQLLLFFGLLFCIGQSAAQSRLQGFITDENDGGAGVPFANVVLKKNGEMVAGTATDFDGNYHLSNIPAGTYVLEISVLGMPTIVVEGLEIRSNATKTYDVSYPKNNNIDDLDIVVVDEWQYSKFGHLSGKISVETAGATGQLFELILRKEGEEIAKTKTDFDGNYMFWDINGGFYVLEIVAIGLPNWAIKKEIHMTNGMAQTYNCLLNAADIEPK
jgi:hypothetical protein